MSDKARRLYPLSAIFAPGEQPDAAKMTALSTQAKASSDKLEMIVGDLWNAAGDIILSPTGNITLNALHIPNLARSLGKLSLLNSFYPGQGPLSTSLVYTDLIGTRYIGATQGYLQFVPAATPNSGNMILAGTFAPLVQIQFQSTPGGVVNTGNWHVDAKGKLYTYDPIPSTLQLVYTPTPNPIVNSAATGIVPEAGWNVIPDPSTWGGPYDGVKISFANNTDATTGYHIWLPPRMPLGSSRIVNSSYDSSSANIQNSPDSGTFLAFQNSASNAALTNGIHYRYNLPTEITSAAANALLPSGFLYLWDEQFGTIIDNVAYYTPANTAHQNFKVRVVSADLVNQFGTSIGDGVITDDTTQLPADYKSRFKLITVGASAAKSISNLIKFAFNHTHKISEGTTPIPHSQLDNLVTPVFSGSESYPPAGPGTDGTVPPFTASEWINDDHYQYLHRGGSTGGSLTSEGNTLTRRDQDDNAIFNQLRIVAKQVSSQAVLNLLSTANFAQVSAFNTGLFLTSDFSSNNAGIFIGAGTYPNIGAMSNTDTLVIAGAGTTGVAKLVNAQFDTIYLGGSVAGEYNRSGSSLVWDDIDQELLLEARTSGSGVFIADTVRANTAFKSNTATGYQFITPITAYADLSPMSLTVQPGGPFSSPQAFNDDLALSNLDGTYVLTGRTVVHFPQGAILGGANLHFQVGLAGGSTGNLIMNFGYYVRASGAGFSPPTANILSSYTFAPSALVANIEFVPTISSHTIDNSVNSYFFYIQLPPKNASTPYVYYGGYVPYTMSYLYP